jgi:hypothetical protein
MEGLQAPAVGGKRFYIFGRIDYVDAFKRDRWTTFCYSFCGYHAMIPLAQQGQWEQIQTAFVNPAPGVVLVFEAANQHNCTDEG